MTITELPVGWVPAADEFGDRLVRMRRTLNLTLREAAEECGLNYRTWQTWEDGRKPQDAMRVVEVISARLGVNRDWLAYGDQPNDAVRLSREQEAAGQDRFSGSDIDDSFLDAIEQLNHKVA